MEPIKRHFYVCLLLSGTFFIIYVIYCYRWLDCLLSRIVFQAKAFVVNASRDRRRANKIITQVLLRLDAIEKQQDKVMEDLRKYLNERVEDTVQQLSEYLQSEKVVARFISWSLDEVPKNAFSWEETEYEIQKVLSSRFQEVITEWEEINNAFANARRDLLQHFQQSYNFFEEQLQNLQTGLTTDGFFEIHHPGRPWITRKVVGVSFLLVAGIGIHVAMFSHTSLVDKMLLIYAAIHGDMLLKDDFRRQGRYESNKCLEMAKMSLDYLAAAARKDKLKFVLQGKFKQAELCLGQIESRIPELIQADKMLYEELIVEKRTKEEVQDLYRPIMHQGSEFRGKLMEFGIKEVCAADVRPEELDWKEDSSSLLGRGVYQGTMSRNGNIETVALKVCSGVLDARNACSVMEEVETLR